MSRKTTSRAKTSQLVQGVRAAFGEVLDQRVVNVRRESTLQHLGFGGLVRSRIQQQQE